jgi:hypothetical protein
MLLIVDALKRNMHSEGIQACGYYQLSILFTTKGFVFVEYKLNASKIIRLSKEEARDMHFFLPTFF